MTPAAAAGAILSGGASRRMGRGIDKALLVAPGDDRPLARRTADVLIAAGAQPVLAIGGDRLALERLGLAWRPDRHPGEGPLGGIITALAVAVADADAELVVVVATDLPALDAPTIASVVRALAADDSLDAALATTDRLEPLCGAWRRRTRPALERAFGRGERAVHAALAELRVRPVPVPAAALRNVNRPSDLDLDLDRGPAILPRAGGIVRVVPGPEIDVDELAERLQAPGTVVVDVREPDEYAAGHVPGAVPMPLMDVPERFEEIDAGDGAEVLVICASGGRSRRAADFLIEQGIAAVNVAGGTRGWIDSGRAVVEGDDPG